MPNDSQKPSTITPEKLKSTKPANAVSAPAIPPAAPLPPLPPEPSSASTLLSGIQVNSETQSIVINKRFFKSFSPRLFYLPFSYAIDLNRAIQKATQKGYKIPSNPVILDTGGMFLSSLLIEVANADPTDKDLISLVDVEFKSRLSQRPWMQLKAEMLDLEKELGKPIEESYVFHAGNKKILLAR